MWLTMNSEPLKLENPVSFKIERNSTHFRPIDSPEFSPTLFALRSLRNCVDKPSGIPPRNPPLTATNIADLFQSIVGMTYHAPVPIDHRG